MRLAVIFHANDRREGIGSHHAIGQLAEIWREQGHEVQFLAGCGRRWDADLGMLHVDTSVVPDVYSNFARRYRPCINQGILDIRKTRISRSLVEPNSDYDGAVIVKTVFNCGGKPERTLHKGAQSRGRMQKLVEWVAADKAQVPLYKTPKHLPGFPKPYEIYPSIKHVPPKVWSNPGLVVEKFLPERDGEWYFVRRSFIIGDHSISYRMGDKQPIVEEGVPEVFEFIETAPEVLARSRELGLDYGTVDHTVYDGKVVIFDVNKTPGRANPPTEVARRDYEKILRTVAPGINHFMRQIQAAPEMVEASGA